MENNSEEAPPPPPATAPTKEKKTKGGVPGPSSAPAKRPRLPKHARIQKRPLLHPSIASPHAGPSQPKILYLKASTPFMSAVKRVKKMISIIEKRYQGHHSSSSGQARHSGRGNTVWKSNLNRTHITKGGGTGVAGGVGGDGRGEGGGEEEEEQVEEVFIKATGRAIEKALNLAAFFQNAKEGYHVSVRTGSIWTVDDIVSGGGKKKSRDKNKRSKKGNSDRQGGEDEDEEGAGEEGMEMEVDGVEDGEEEKTETQEEQLPETRTRRLSYLQIGVRLKRA
ncbi:MAG: exosome non-catalytic core subunit rrp40 [Watsoniomyces obsoletus]|nr:MAG: exosome non-catalytic core subunit rrp40 [Watsoniomyces obsoletus]